jgi:hypothetical protein
MAKSRNAKEGLEQKISRPNFNLQIIYGTFPSHPITAEPGKIITLLIKLIWGHGKIIFGRAF